VAHVSTCRVEIHFDAKMPARVPARQAEARATPLRMTIDLHAALH